MTYETKDNTGSVFNNDRKEKDTHPDRTGSAVIGGTAYWVSGWIKQDRNGKPYLSLAFKPKETPAARVDHQNERPKPRATRDDMDSEIPF